jgi:hypothetical protein
MTFIVPATTASNLLTQQDLDVNQNFIGPNYLVNGASVDSNTLALASLRNPFLQRNPFLNANALNSFDDLSTFGVGSDFTQAALLSNLHQSSPALLQRAKNEVPLARIGLQQFQHQLAFNDRSETRQIGFQDKSETRQLGFQNVSEQRQLAFADRADSRSFELQNKKDERSFWGNLIGSLAPAVIGLFKNNSDGAREERMFKYAQSNKVNDIKEAYEQKYEKQKLMDRIAQLERKLDRYKDHDDDTVKKPKKRKRKENGDNDKVRTVADRTEDPHGNSSWVVVKATAKAKSETA